MTRLVQKELPPESRSQGTGLGLSVVHGIVDAHGGHLAVESAPGEGARFDIFLPTSTSLGAPLPPRAVNG